MDRDDDDEFGNLCQGDLDVGFKTSSELDLNVEHVCGSQKVVHANGTLLTISPKEAVGVDVTLRIGTEFESDEHAYKLYNRYARFVGFSVRKDWVNRSKVHGLVVSRKFTCSREGYRRKDKRDGSVKKHRKETRTGCLAHLIITRQPDGRYRVSHFEENHNHDFINPNIALTLPLQKELRVDQSCEVDVAEDLGSQSKTTFEATNGKFRVRDSLDDLASESDTCLQTERVRDMKDGEAGVLMNYFQRQRFENPSLFYSLQLDIDDKLTNIFWADDSMISDYGHFGDVVCLDTICLTKKDHFPFVQFFGLNHHKQVVIFAAAFLYDDTVESFKWLFRTFLETTSGKKPKAIHTDQDAAIIEAVNSVLPETKRCICVWQMYENAVRHLNSTMKDTESFTSDLRRCIYDPKDEEEFVHAWEEMLTKYSLQHNEWLKWMFREREKWAVVYCTNTFFVDMKGSHLGEILFNDLRSYLNSDLDMVQFFRHYESVIDELRYKEIEASDEMNRCKPRLMANVVLLKHASDFYTPGAFESFQLEYEKCLNVVVNQFGENGSLFEYKANKFGKTREHNLTFNSSDESVSCNCEKFESVGFLCSHSLRVLDHRNIKVVPSKYILRRWTKDAKLASVTQFNEFSMQDNPKMIPARRYKDLCRRIVKLSARASESDEAFLFASRKLDEVIEGVEKILRLKPDEAQAVTSSSTGANASESDHAEIFLDRNAIDDRNDNAMGDISVANGIHNEALTQNSPSVYVSRQVATETPIMQGLYNFEANQVVKCMYQQPNFVMDNSTNSNVYQPPNFYTNQHDSPSQSQLLQDPLIHNTYTESIANTAPLRQEMDHDIQHPHSASFYLLDQRYRAPDNPFLGHK